MNILRQIPVVAALAAASVAHAGAVVDLAPSEFVSGLSGINNHEMSELIGSSISDKYINFSIYGTGEGVSPLYEGTLMTRVVRSHMTGNLTFNYRVMNANPELDGRISHIEVGGFSGWETRVEYRDDAISTGNEGPMDAMRYAHGDILDFSFSGGLDTWAESHYFFAMTDTDTFYADSTLATIYLESGESVSLVVDSANPAVPAPGSLALLGGAGLLCSRRRR
ncbi:MAG: PEP-CTERM sorting domain-containing protein [Phycisphaerales bacterium]|nr:PEP-CTERM sorting domain-containing protein [Phycisphaerales bacterium]